MTYRAGQTRAEVDRTTKGRIADAALISITRFNWVNCPTCADFAGLMGTVEDIADTISAHVAFDPTWEPQW